MFLDKTSKKILKSLVDSQDKATNGIFLYETISTITGMDVNTIKVHTDHLKEMGCVKTRSYSNTNTPYGVSLTPSGIYYKQYSWHLIKEFVLKSVLVPIAVSVITSCVYNFVQALLKF